MSAESNKAIVRREQEEFWGKGNEAVAEEIFAPQVIEGDGHQVSIADLRASMRGLHAAAPDLQVVVLDLIAEGDKVVARVEARGTQAGELMGISAIGKRFTIPGTVTRRLAGGKIVERWDCFDWLSWLREVGAVPGAR